MDSGRVALPSYELDSGRMFLAFSGIARRRSQCVDKARVRSLSLAPAASPARRRISARVHGGRLIRHAAGGIRRRCCAGDVHRLGPAVRTAATCWHLDLRNRSHAVHYRRIAAKIFGSSNDRRVKGYRPRVEAINALEPEIERLSDAELRARTEDVPQAARGRRDARRPAGAGLRHRARGGQAHARPAPLRRAADRRHGAARGQDRRDEDRRGQDAGRHAAGLSQRARRQGRARRHRQRLPGQARRRVDGPGLQVPRPHRRRASCTTSTTSSAGRSTPATSPTAPTTSSASTTCATT